MKKVKSPSGLLFILLLIIFCKYKPQSKIEAREQQENESLKVAWNEEFSKYLQRTVPEDGVRKLLVFSLIDKYESKRGIILVHDKNTHDENMEIHLCGDSVVVTVGVVKDGTKDYIINVFNSFRGKEFIHYFVRDKTFSTTVVKSRMLNVNKPTLGADLTYEQMQEMKKLFYAYLMKANQQLRQPYF